MLKPAVQPRRLRGPTLIVSLAFVAGALVGVGGSLVGFLLAPTRVVVVEREARPAVTPPIVDVAEPVVIQALPTGASLSAKVSPRYQTIDLLSPGAYIADGTRDEVFDIELNAPLAVRHIFVNGNGGAYQWDTVIGDESIPFGRVYGGRQGEVTWHVGVREQGRWQTSTKTGALGGLPAGAHKLELIGNGVHDWTGPRTVTVMFIDGTTITAQVAPREHGSECYASQLGGC